MPTLRWLGVSLAVALGLTLTPATIAFLIHLLSYRGVCGPHAPDISARPCGPLMYIPDFFGGFALAGLYIVTVPAAALGLLVGAVVFVGGLLWRWWSR